MSRSPDRRRSGNGESFLAGVNDEALSAQETNQRQTQFARQLYSETRRCGNRCQQRNAGGDRFLNDFKSAPSTYQQHVIVERQAAAEQRPADRLVHGIVSTDVFAQDEQFASRAEKRGSMQSAGSAKDNLRRAQSWRQLTEQFRIKQRSGLRAAQTSTPELRNGSFPADAAGRPRGKSACRAIRREAYAWIEGYTHEIPFRGFITWQ